MDEARNKLRPVRVPSYNAVCSPRSAVESPTLGAATAMAGASLSSPRVSGITGAPAPVGNSRPSSSLATKSYSINSAERDTDSTEFAQPRGIGTDESGISSPSKRLRSRRPLDATSSAKESGGTGKSRATSDGDQEVEDDTHPSPTKRQTRKSLADKPVEPPPSMTVVDMFSPGMLRVNVYRIPALLALPDGVVCAASTPADQPMHSPRPFPARHDTLSAMRCLVQRA